MRLCFAAATVLLTLAANAAEPLSPDNFGARFNDMLRSIGLNYRAGKTECGEKMARTCTYNFNSIGFVVKSQDGGKGFEWVTVICAKGCEPMDFAVAVSGVVRVLSPGLPRNRYGEWLPVMNRVLTTKSSEAIDIGRTEVLLTVNDVTGINAIVSQR